MSNLSAADVLEFLAYLTVAWTFGFTAGYILTIFRRALQSSV